MGDLRGLSLWQPWASLIALGFKSIETRGWSTSYRGRMLIHASQRLTGRRGDRFTVGAFEVERDAAGYLLRGPDLAWPYRLPLGAVVATCELVDVLPIVGHGDQVDLSRPYIGWWTGAPPEPPDGRLYIWEEDEPVLNITVQAPYGDYSPGRFGFELEGVEALRTPLPMRGRQGLWRPGAVVV